MFFVKRCDVERFLWRGKAGRSQFDRNERVQTPGWEAAMRLCLSFKATLKALRTVATQAAQMSKSSLRSSGGRVIDGIAIALLGRYVPKKRGSSRIVLLFLCFALPKSCHHSITPFQCGSISRHILFVRFSANAQMVGNGSGVLSSPRSPRITFVTRCICQC